MELPKKNENWWLRLTIVLVILLSLSTLTYYSKRVTLLTAKSTSDSTAFYKMKCDSLSIKNDSLVEMNGFYENQIGLRDMVIEQAKQASPRMMEELLKNTGGLAYEE